jgi:hypothetical protein
MKKPSLKADKERVERARLFARESAFDTLMQRLRHINTGRRFSRDEMNERRPQS